MGGGGVDGWTDEQAQTNLPLICPITMHLCINIQVMSPKSSIYDHFII